MLLLTMKMETIYFFEILADVHQNTHNYIPVAAAFVVETV
jgi:hypothetical protein